MKEVLKHVRLLTTVSVVSLASFAAHVAFAEGDQSHLTPLKIIANCTTGSTTWDGKRKACDSPLHEWKAPAGHALDRESLSGGLTTKNGSEYGCRVNFLEPTEVVPGLQAPTKVTLQAHARSAGGMGSSGARGWATCEYTLRLVRLPKQQAGG